LEKGNLSEQEKILAGKNSLSKKVISLSKKGFPDKKAHQYIQTYTQKLAK
jgi:hypothetical protein